MSNKLAGRGGGNLPDAAPDPLSQLVCKGRRTRVYLPVVHEAVHDFIQYYNCLVDLAPVIQGFQTELLDQG